MADYYDKGKFTGKGGGGAPPPPPPPNQPPPPKPKNSSGWYSWPAIIILFALQLWPVALVLLFLKLFGGEKKLTDAASQVRQGGYEAQTRRNSYEAQARSMVEQAMRMAENKVERKVGDAFNQAGLSVDQAIQRTMAQMERTIERTARQVEQTGRSARRAAPPSPKTKPAKQKKAKPAGVLLRILGIICLAVGGIVGLISTMELLQTSLLDFEALGISAGFLFSGGLMFFRGLYLNKMSRRSQRYILAIGNVDAMPLDEIAKRVNRKPSQAVKELQKLIDKGYLGEDAYIDREKGYFLRFGATLEEEEDPFEQPAPEPTPQEVQEGYSGILRNIRHANDRIADPVLSRKIDRLEQVSALIFKEVEEHPEKRSTIHTFFDYYLPTTQKLLDTYADFEETGVEGENLREAKVRIEQTMDLIVAGFEHQLDQLYSSDAMDVASDIKVMEAMLKRDTASAAKDFGYPEAPKLTLTPDKDQNGGQTQTM